MKYINLIMQGKGGAGKTFVALCLCEYFIAKERELVVIDTDPVNATLSKYETLPCRHAEIISNGEINDLAFDKIIEDIVESPDETYFVIDTAASTFLPIVKYLKDTGVIDLLYENDCEVIIHSVVSGGGAIDDTLSCIEKIFQMFPDQKVVIWKNEYSGRIEKSGKQLEELQIYKQNEERIFALPVLQQRSGSSFNYDIQTMIEKRKMFFEAIKDESFGIMSRQRIKKVWTDVFCQLEVMAL